MTTPADALLDALGGILDELGRLVQSTLAGGAARGLSDAQLRDLTTVVEAVGRRVDALRVSCAGEIDARSRPEKGSERMSAQHGCANATELLVRLTRISSATAGERLRLGRLTTPQTSMSGETVSPPFTVVRDALEGGDIGLDAAAMITRTLAPIADRCSSADLRAAETDLVAAAAAPRRTALPHAVPTTPASRPRYGPSCSTPTESCPTTSAPSAAAR